MLRRLLPVLGLVLIASASAGGAASAGEASTIRIEPRPFYGATVTLEAGVRVFRPLPPTKRVIINPNGTPLSLSQTDIDVDVDVKETRNIYHRDGGHGRVSPYVVYGGFGSFGGAKRLRRNFRGAHGPRRSGRPGGVRVGGGH